MKKVLLIIVCSILNLGKSFFAKNDKKGCLRKQHIEKSTYLCIGFKSKYLFNN